MYMNIHKTGFSAVFHISVMIFKLTHLIHLDLDHQNVFRQFHILFNQNQINSSIRLSGIRLSGIRLSGIRLSGIRLSGIRLSGIRLSGIRLSGIRLSGIRLSGIRLPGIRLSGIRLSGTRLFYHAYFFLNISFGLLNNLFEFFNRSHQVNWLVATEV